MVYYELAITDEVIDLVKVAVQKYLSNEPTTQADLQVDDSEGNIDCC